MLAPGVFDQDDDGVVLLLRDTVDDGDEATAAAVKSAANVCPAAAIRLSAQLSANQKA
ncbi:putative ferredoxin [Sphingobium chlorophenolicum]|uniref:Putative ferredoxin n=2 Tax=Sphingobium chlorophenolicum TaxID=46429 RepID=A0A081R9V3_SPHCR|nr:putative ferredoxin [Sphingobium chlorophenolicum]